MDPRQLILLSPYQVPAQNSLMLAAEDVGAFLNGYIALWHPAALAGAAEPPRVGSPYDYEQPTAGHVYAVPESPPLILPDDWDQRVHDAGAVAFRATADRAATLANLALALGGASASGEQPPQSHSPLAPHGAPPTQVKAFFGIGFGYMHVLALFQAMEHDNLLATGEFWQDVQSAAAALNDPEPNAYRRHLQSAADKLLAAREVLYPASIHLLDLFLLGEEHLEEALQSALGQGTAVNVVASTALLEKIGRELPGQLDKLRERVAGENLDVCGGCYLEREDALLPVESQLWNLRKGLALARELLATDIRIFGRKRFGFHPQVPLFLNFAGLNRALLLPFDDAVLPTFQATVTNWPSPDGKQVEAFTRAPHAAGDSVTYFHAAHYLHRSIMQDHAATLALLHKEAAAAPWHEDWLELSQFGPVLGQWTTLTKYFNEVLAGEHAGASAADDFHADYLSERTGAASEDAVSGLAGHVRRRRQIDTAWTLTAIHRALAGKNDTLQLDTQLSELEERVEARCGCSQGTEAPGPAADLDKVQNEAALVLAERLLSRATAETPGYMLLNPCGFARRVALELNGISSPLPIAGPLKACQIDGDKARLVVEVPALGFAWFPRTGPPGTPAMPSRMRLADARHVRNEFFEADIDPGTGGLRGLCDHRTRVNRIAQQLVFNPGSVMRARDIQVTSSGPALGEVVSEGAILGDQEQVLATFRQRFRAWLGRPILDLRLEIYPEQPPAGYPWHAYYGARFAWRDERMLLLRGVNGTAYVTSHSRPQSPDYLEWRHGRQNTVLFPCGLPFHQRQGARMLDLILVPEGEKGQIFDIALGLDKDYPMQTAVGLVSPAPLVPVAKGPPHVGTSGWLFHLDAPNLVLNCLRPAAEGAHAVVARLQECGVQGGSGQFRCFRNPQRAMLLDGRGELMMDAYTTGDAVEFSFSQGDLFQLRVEFE
jgi:hypothetical protein